VIITALGSWEKSVPRGHCILGTSGQNRYQHLLRTPVVTVTKRWPRGTGFPQLPSMVASTVDHP
jgi:hypothetical protein